MQENEMKTYGYTPQQYKKFRALSVRYLLFFSLLYCFLYCTRLNLSGAGAAMMESLSWSSREIGVLTGTLFWTYGIGQLVNGRLSEIYGTTRFLTLAVLLSCGINILMGFQSALWIMAILWGINGYVQSMAWTPGIAALTNWWPGNRRGFATGFAHAFSGFGQAVATLAVAAALQLLPSQGWRSAFWLPAALPLILLVIFRVCTVESPSKAGLPEYKEDDPKRAENEEIMRKLMAEKGKFYPYKHVLSDKRFLIWVLIAFIVGLSRYGLSTWIPMYFIDRFNMDITDGLLQSLTLPVGMGIGTLVVPALTDRFCPDNRLPAVILSAVVGAAAVGSVLLLDPRVAWQSVLLQALLFIAGFCIYAINGTAWAYATDIGGRVFSGTASGVLNFSAYMGAAVQSVLYGFLLHHLGWSMVFASVAILCGSIAVLGAAGSSKKQDKTAVIPD